MRTGQDGGGREGLGVNDRIRFLTGLRVWGDKSLDLEFVCDTHDTTHLRHDI